MIYQFLVSFCLFICMRNQCFSHLSFCEGFVFFHFCSILGRKTPHVFPQLTTVVLMLLYLNSARVLQSTAKHWHIITTYAFQTTAHLCLSRIKQFKSESPSKTCLYKPASIYNFLICSIINSQFCFTDKHKSTDFVSLNSPISDAFSQ